MTSQPAPLVPVTVAGGTSLGTLASRSHGVKSETSETVATVARGADQALAERLQPVGLHLPALKAGLERCEIVLLPVAVRRAHDPLPASTGSENFDW